MQQPVDPQRIVVLNTKGGSGKTTLATNLAAYYAVSGRRVALMDLDPQGSSMRWLRQRPPEAPPIHGIAGYEKRLNVTRSFALRSPPGTEHVIVDTPAALSVTQMPETVRDASAIIVPVLPSDIDIHAAAKCISDLLLIAKVRRDEHRIAVVANRAKKNTLIYKSLMKFLETLHIPVVTTLRDSQNYIRVAESGAGLFEMKPTQVREDLEQWLPLVGWLAQRRPIPLQAGAPATTSLLRSSAITPTAETPPGATTPAIAPLSG